MSESGEGTDQVQLNRDGKPLTHKQKQNLKRKAKRKDKYQQEKKIKTQLAPPSARSSSEDETEEQMTESNRKINKTNHAADKSRLKLSKSKPSRDLESSSDVSDNESEPEDLRNTIEKGTTYQHQLENSESESDTADERETGSDLGKFEDDSDEQEEEEECNSGEEMLSGEEDVTKEDTSAEAVDQGYTELRKELSNMSFDELQQLKEKIGLKLYNQVMFSQETNTKPKRFKRENKNRPMEVSSKRKPRRGREVVQVKKGVVRDPRFDDLSGEYKEDIFKSTYSFLTDVKKNEKQKILKRLTKEKNEEKKEQLEYLVRRMAAQEKAERNKEQQQGRDRQRKKQERTLVSEGKQAFYLKQSDKKKLELAEKFQELKKAGKVDTYLSKKRKKNAQKERRNLPTQ